LKPLIELDRELAKQYGSYASYTTDTDPVLVETYGDGPAEEVDRLLDVFATPGSQVLDLGCGAGFTLCRLAPQVDAIWGFDEDADLLAAARERVASQGIANATLVLGNVAEPDDVAKLPDEAFDVVLSRRGPDVNATVMAKLKPEATVIQELYQDPVGLLELLGRQTFLAQVGHNPQRLVESYSWLGLFPVSVKEYYYASFYRDIEHLAAHLSRENELFSWPMPPMPYEEARDRQALELYARYNATPKGIRLLNHRKVYLFRRARVRHAPVAPEVKPRWMD
jgi:SAM-dependent methyltransferase